MTEAKSSAECKGDAKSGVKAPASTELESSETLALLPVLKQVASRFPRFECLAALTAKVDDHLARKNKLAVRRDLVLTRLLLLGNCWDRLTSETEPFDPYGAFKTVGFEDAMEVLTETRKSFEAKTLQSLEPAGDAAVCRACCCFLFWSTLSHLQSASLLALARAMQPSRPDPATKRAEEAVTRVLVLLTNVLSLPTEKSDRLLTNTQMISALLLVAHLRFRDWVGASKELQDPLLFDVCGGEKFHEFMKDNL